MLMMGLVEEREGAFDRLQELVSDVTSHVYSDSDLSGSSCRS